MSTVHVLLVEPDYYTRFPPLGLLKLAAYHKMKNDTVELVRGCRLPKGNPQRIYVTSLFTYTWKPVHQAVRYFKELYPTIEVWLGGIYASLMPEHAQLSGADRIWTGLFDDAEDLMPDYSLVPEWDASIIFASRGCIRNCAFCAVPKLEGRPNRLRYHIEQLVYPGHKRIILWDNNILGNPNWRPIFDELIELGLKVDFNQGLDARLISDESAEGISKMKTEYIRLAYDTLKVGPYVENAINVLSQHGIRKKKIIVYTLFNFDDDPKDFFQRVKHILNWGSASYPMRFQPLDSLNKNEYVGPNWTREELDKVQRARRVLGCSGAFPPYDALIVKFNKAKSFDEAFSLRPPRSGDFMYECVPRLLGSAYKRERGAREKVRVRWVQERDWRKVAGTSKT